MEKGDERLKEELNPFVRNYAEINRVAKAHLDSFNRFLSDEIPDIIRRNDVFHPRGNPSVYIRYRCETLRIGRPSSIMDADAYTYMSEEVTPMKCRLAGTTYYAPIFVDIEYRNRGGAPSLVKGHMIGQIPVMLKSGACSLWNLKEDELVKYVECQLDPGGYFIIKGQEKVLLIREELARNKIFIGRDEKGRVQATVVSRTRTIESAAVLVLDDGIVYLNLRQFSTKVPIMVVIKAMGMELDDNIKGLVGLERKYLDLFELSVQDCKAREINTQKHALKFLEEVRKPEQKCGSMDILCEIFLCHIPVDGNNFRAKCIFVAFMVKRLLEAHYNILKAEAPYKILKAEELEDEANVNKNTLDDLNYVGNRRLELPGDLLSLLFEDLFKEMSEAAIKFYTFRVNKFPKVDIFSCIERTRIFNGLELALSTGIWNIKRSRMHLKGMTEVVPRLSFIATLSSLRRILQQDKALGNVT